MEGVAGPFMPAWCLICTALLACLSPAQPTKSLDLSLTLTNNVIHVNDVPEHLLTMYPVCTLRRDRHCMYIEHEQAQNRPTLRVSRAAGQISESKLAETCNAGRAGAQPYQTRGGTCFRSAIRRHAQTPTRPNANTP